MTMWQGPRGGPVPQPIVNLRSNEEVAIVAEIAPTRPGHRGGALRLGFVPGPVPRSSSTGTSRRGRRARGARTRRRARCTSRARPPGRRAKNCVKNGTWKYPLSSSGTPRSTLPSAAPRTMAMSARGQRKDRVPEAAPQRVVLWRAELDGEAAQDEQPQHHHQRQVEAAEPRRVGAREKREHQHPAGGDEPDLVAVPHRADRGEHGAALGVGLAPRTGEGCRRRSRSRRARRRRRA